MTTLPHSVDLGVKPEVTAFFDEPTNTVSYVVKDPSSNACAVIDSVMDIDYAAGRISYQSADEIIRFVQEHGLKVEWLIETHAHADHLSAAPYIQGKLGGKLGIGWGLVGYCPGPAIAALSAGPVSTFIFVAAMLAGMATARGVAVANFARSNTAVAGSAGGTR